MDRIIQQIFFIISLDEFTEPAVIQATVIDPAERASGHPSLIRHFESTEVKATYREIRPTPQTAR